MKFKTQKTSFFGINNPFFGKKHSAATKKKISDARKGKSTGDREKHWNWKGGVTLKNLTERKACLFCKKPIWIKSEMCHKCRQQGERHPNWRGGITKERVKIWRSAEYKNWRKAVFERDSYTCQICGDKNGNGHQVFLNADHIKSFKHFPKLRFVVSNGRTLCVSCHRKTPNYGRRI